MVETDFAMNENKSVLYKTIRFRKRLTAFEIMSAMIIIAGAISMLLPFFWMLLASLKTNAEFYNSTKWIPDQPNWNNYKELLFPEKGFGFLHYFFNNAKVTVLSVIGMVVACTLAGFGFARIKFPGRDLVFALAVMTMFLPSQVTIIPLFVVFTKLKWIGTHLPLYVPSFFGAAFGIFLMRQFFLTVPSDFDEAAKIDGCGWFGIFRRIHLPLVLSPMITLAILTFQEKWAELLNPMIYIGKKQELWTIVLRIKDISTGQYNSRPELEMAGNLLLVLPVIILFIVAQKYFAQSITSSGVKG